VAPRFLFWVNRMNKVLEAARIYAKHFQGWPRFLVLHRPRICPFERLLDFVPQRASILDVGCGSGFFLFCCRVLRSAVFTAGTDVSALAIARAEAVAANTRTDKGGYVFKVCDVPQEWPSGEFNVVCMIDVLHHIAPGQVTDFIQTAAARLSPGGVLIIKDMLPVPLLAGLLNRLHDLVIAGQWINYVRLDTLADMLLKQGFELVCDEKLRMFWYAHRWVVLRKKA